MTLSFKTKIILGFLGVGVIPLCLVSGYLLYGSYSQAYHDNGNTIEALHDESSERVEEYFQLVKDQTQERAQSRIVKDALKEFTAAVNGLNPAIAGVDEAKLKERYTLQASKIEGATPTDADTWEPASAKAKALQYLYIAKNANPVGEKDKLTDAGDGSAYSAVHAKYHAAFKRYVDTFGYYDMMLIDAATGDVVYTDFKEIDFMSNVNTGPLANSIFSKTVKKAMASNDPKTIILSDFEPYMPSYNDWAGFVAAPVVEGGKTLGVVAYQIPIEKMASSFKFVQSMGKTGDGFLIGPDMKFRTPPLTVKAKVGAPIPAGLAQSLEKVFQSNFSGLSEWTGGNTGDEPFFGAMQKLGVPELNWAIVVRVDKNEILASFYRQLYISLGLLALVLAIGVGAGLFMSNRLVRPVQGLAKGFNKGQTMVAQSATQMGEAVSSMIAASEETSTQSKVIKQSSNEAAGYVSAVTGAIEELNISIHDISQSIGETNVLIDDAVSKAQKTDEVVRSLGEASKRITEVVSLINDLAEQTNLLALNAAIEAARAGDAGRGFAVVADEVKKLAAHTSQATVDIKSQINEVQDVSDQSVVALQAVVEAIHRIRDNATTVSAAVEEQSGVARQITVSVKEAAGRVQDVDRNMVGIDQAANDTAVAAEQVNRSMSEVTGAVGGMKTEVESVLTNMGIKA